MESVDQGSMRDGGQGRVVSDSQVVFQCESCRSILGDATNWIAADETLECFTLSSVTDSVCVGDILHHSTHVHDAGSSYFTLTCAHCKVELGWNYITTPSHLDHLRSYFTFHVSMVTSYQLGSAGVKGMSEVKGQEPPLLLKVAECCMKLQHVVVTHDQRLSSIEKFLKEDAANTCLPSNNS